MKVGNEALKQINEMLNIEDVERILDETQEAAEKQRVCFCYFIVVLVFVDVFIKFFDHLVIILLL